jgi:hypothetical protein
MRKLLQLVFCLLLALPVFFCCKNSTKGRTSLSAGGSVARSALVLSTVNGTAFVDFGVAGVLTSNLGMKLTILDSSRHPLVGYIKAAGTGQTYGSQLLPNTTFANTTGVSGNGATVAIITSGCYSAHCLQITLAGAYGLANESTSLPISAGMSMRESSYVKMGTERAGSGISVWNSSYSQVAYATTRSTTWVPVVLYFTGNTTGTYYPLFGGVTSGDTSLFDTASLTQVLTPSTTGVTITSKEDGTTYNWTSEDASFNPNDPRGYTYYFSR